MKNNGSRLWSVAVLAGGLFAVAAVAGCYTRLTTPKEAFNYLRGGQVIGSAVAKAILAPDYNAYMRSRGFDDPGERYQLRPGTRIHIKVYGHDIAETLNIRPDGIIDLPLIGDVRAEGKTIAALKEEISTRFSAFFVEPPQVILNTEVSEFGNEVQAGKVSVINPTGNQGVVNLTGDERLSQVLSAANALHTKSEWNEVAIIREGTAVKERYLIICDIEKLVRSGDLDQDVRMRNGDIVFIPFERNTLLEEFWATFEVLGQLTSNAETMTRYIDYVEGF